MAYKELSLKGKVAIIVGDGAGWSKVLASALVEAGASVAVAGPRAEIPSDGKIIMSVPTSITSPEEIRKTAQAVIDRWGGIDILVNNSSMPFTKPFSEVTPEEWRRVIDANLTSVFLSCKEIGRHMLKRGKGSIINIMSSLAAKGLPNHTTFCASQGGILQLTRSLALEWSRDGIRVNAIGAGWFTQKAGSADTLKRLERYIPLRRFGQPDDLAGLLVYLTSEASCYVTGDVFYVDGGVLIRG